MYFLQNDTKIIVYSIKKHQYMHVLLMHLDFHMKLVLYLAKAI